MAYGTLATLGLGLGSSLLGGLMEQGDANKSLGAAQGLAAFQPTNIQGGDLGSITGTAGGGFNLSPSAQQQLLSGLFGGAAVQALGGGGTYGQDFQTAGGGAVLPAFQGLQGMLGQQLPTQEFGAQNAILQQLQSGLLGQGAGALGQGIAGLNPNAAFGMGGNFLGQAQGLLGQAGNVQGLVDDRLSALRAQAAPQEEQAFNSLQNKLFSQGRLGSTGGSRDFEAFGRGLGQADLGRQMAAQDLGLRTSGLLQQGAGIAGGLGQGLFGQGFGAAGQLAGLGGGLIGQGVGFGQQGLNNILGLQDVGINRAQQRMQNAMSLFGFGQDVQGGRLGQALQATQGISGSLAPLFDLGNLSARFSEARGLSDRAQAQYAGQQQGAGGLFGGLLGGLGGGLLGGLF
jgi:hypothetical protein